MSERYLVVFPRGFIGVNNPGINKETNSRSLSQQVSDLRFNNPPKVDDNGDVFNQNVTKLYRAMIDQVATRDKFTFNNAVLTEAIRCFGSMDFNDWIRIQRRARYFSRNHQNFILDTLRFIATGKRETSTRTWEIVLRRKLIEDVESVTTHPKFDREVTAFFQTVGNNGQVIGTNLYNVLTEWLSQRNGAEDLLLTLNIVFGKELNATA